MEFQRAREARKRRRGGKVGDLDGLGEQPVDLLERGRGVHHARDELDDVGDGEAQAHEERLERAELADGDLLLVREPHAAAEHGDLEDVGADAGGAFEHRGEKSQALAQGALSEAAFSEACALHGFEAEAFYNGRFPARR